MKLATLMICLLTSLSAYAYQSPEWVQGQTSRQFNDENERMLPGSERVPYEYRRIDGYWRYTDRSYRDQWGRTVTVTRREWVPAHYEVVRTAERGYGRAHVKGRK